MSNDRRTGQILHHWRWHSPHYLITCGNRAGLIDVSKGAEAVTCKNCLRTMKARGWL